MIRLAGKIPEILDDNSLIERLQNFVAENEDLRYREYIEIIGGYKSLLAITKTMGAKSGRHATQVVEQIIELNYESFVRTIGLYKNNMG
ncbi:hypothetical protein J4446_02610 [Candidatus Woesearchaeota archaeon]|nr:hypothetical protein [Candidatus Woesearchaeota archaeon]